MTLEEYDAEIARMDKHLRWLKQDIIAEINEFLAEETNPYARENLTRHLEKVRAMPPVDS